MDDSVGRKLREARTRRKLSLAEVEAATKIRGRYLQAIENDEWDELPGETYARAFIRTYGRFLGLDGERLAEEQRRSRGAERPGERLPRAEPRPVAEIGRRRGDRGSRISPRTVVAAVTVLVLAALLAIGLATGGGSGGGGTQPGSTTPGKSQQGAQRHEQAAPAGHSLLLVATGEVWVCLLNGKGNPVLDGVILAPGQSEGPFRSASFTVALGNGAVTMTVDGKRQSLPEPPSPIGFAVGRDGTVRELPSGERPLCS